MRLFGASRTNPDVELPRPEVVPSRDRVSTAHGRIIIAGTGRAGTTFLVQMFTALGFGTGFARNQSFQEVDEISHSGLEKALVDEDNPYVIKSPLFADDLASALRENRVRIYAALIPMRDCSALQKAAAECITRLSAVVWIRWVSGARFGAPTSRKNRRMRWRDNSTKQSFH